MGEAAIPWLTELLGEEQLLLGEHPRAWEILERAAALLGELGSGEAEAEALVRLLWLYEPRFIAYEGILAAVVGGVGGAALEPLLRAWSLWRDGQVPGAWAEDADPSTGIAEALSNLGVRDDRILAVLLEVLASAPALGASFLEQYGDPAALPTLSRALDQQTVEPNSLFLTPFAELEMAILALGGELSASQRDRVTRARAAQCQASDKMRRLLGQATGGEASPEQLAQRLLGAPGRRPGRNDACWCGSGIKYKRCHWGEDRRLQGSR